MSLAPDIAAIERPRRELLTYYLISSFAFGPAFPVAMAARYLRFRTMRYRFDEDGVSMSWGVLFRREIHLTYARIQDIHLSSNVLERWLDLARIEIQTASGSSSAEMTIEGVAAPDRVRDYLYERMRGAREEDETPPPTQPRTDGDLAAILREIAEELRGVRRELERRSVKSVNADAKPSD